MSLEGCALGGREGARLYDSPCASWCNGRLHRIKGQHAEAFMSAACRMRRMRCRWELQQVAAAMRVYVITESRLNEVRLAPARPECVVT